MRFFDTYAPKIKIMLKRDSEAVAEIINMNGDDEEKQSCSHRCDNNLLLLALVAAEAEMKIPTKKQDRFDISSKNTNFHESTTTKGSLLRHESTDERCSPICINVQPMIKIIQKQRVVRTTTFVVKLMNTLLDSTYQNFIGWCNNGKAFVIKDSDEFVQHLLPNVFKQAKFESFTRKLYRWGFRRVMNTSNNHTFYHEFFLRDKPMLCLKMRSGNIVSSNVDITRNLFPNSKHSVTL